MSNIYNLEPPTNGKVVLKTTAGDIDIELWAKEAPKAVRNFVQLCLEGYYDGCQFFRVVKDFLVQTGDPTNTGAGGQSIYGEPFKDEFHSRLRFSHRGIVACANENREHSNGSQFFLTLGPTESLQKKNTIFGRVGGDTIYNLMEMNALEVNDDDKPEHPPIIKEVEVLWNPFEDIVPRITPAERRAAAERAAAEAAAAAKPVKRKKKNVQLLSFEDDEEGEEGAAGAAGGRLKSAHELVDDERLVKANTEAEKRLAAEEAAEAERMRASVAARLAKRSAAKSSMGGVSGGAAAESPEDEDTEEGFEAHMRAQVLQKQRAFGGAAPSDRDGKGGAKPSSDSDDDDDDESGSRKQKDAEKRRAAALAGGSKAAMIRPSRQVNVEDAELLKPWEQKRQAYKQRKKLTGRREKDTLAKMKAFTTLLTGGGAGGGESAAAGSADSPAAREAEGAARPSGEAAATTDEAYSGRVRKDIDHDALKPAAWRIDALQDEEDEFEGGLDALRNHVLVFPKEKKLGTMDRDMDDDNLVVVDPLLEKGKEKWNKQQAKLQKRQTEWGGGGPPQQRQRT